MNANGNKPLEDRLQKSSQVDGSERKRANSKSIHWADQELMNVTDFGSDDSATQNMKTTSEHTAITIPPQNGGLQISSAAAAAAHQDTLPLLNDLRSRLSLENSFPETLLLAEESTTASDEEARQAALNDLITHLEDTAALLREQLAPKEAVELDETSSEQTTFLLKYQVVLVFFTQTVSILLLTLFDHLTGETDTGYEVLKRSTGSILQLVNMMLVVFATVVLSRQMLKYKVEGSFLAQTYIATVITFAGLYFIIYRFQPSSWEFASQDKMEDSIAIEQYIRMLYLSVSAATLCGAANIQPRSWYVTLLLCFQSLVNFVYFASILAQTIGNYHSYTVQVRRSSSMSRSNHPPSSRISSKS